MSLDDLSTAIETEYSDLTDELAVTLDRETKHELAMLAAVFDVEDTDELVRRAVHLLFQSSVETGRMDFHLRQGYDVTYDEYLSGMTYEEMTGGGEGFTPPDDDRRYQF
ncbi:MAG: hypothetical protein R3324_03875 [Halobacteriales archaeon]|nr:hypothetical protein [Halobacteriales archaeon]